jgi:6-pyruvoyltetrahydropterin/6-carboxytetrahydropterin synthase
MYEVKIKAEFSAAHNLREVGGKCEALHGHNFTVEVGVEAENLNEVGLVMDFRQLKAHTRAALEVLDHHYLNELPPFAGKNPSSENIAAYLFAELSRQIDGGPIRVNWVSVWESESSQATYRGPKR